MWRAAEARGNKLKGGEYEDTTWSAQTWTSYTMQRISCALARGVAAEIATSMQLTRARDPRDDDAGAGDADAGRVRGGGGGV